MSPTPGDSRAASGRTGPPLAAPPTLTATEVTPQGGRRAAPGRRDGGGPGRECCGPGAAARRPAHRPSGALGRAGRRRRRPRGHRLAHPDAGRALAVWLTPDSTEGWTVATQIAQLDWTNARALEAALVRDGFGAVER